MPGGHGLRAGGRQRSPEQSLRLALVRLLRLDLRVGILDGGDTFIEDAGVDGGSTVVDAGSGGSGIDTTGWQVAQFSGTLSTGQITGLTNGTCYDFVVQTVVDDGTQGVNSSEVVVAPIKNYDFWRLYQLDGGGDAGGLHCQAGGGAVGILGMLAALLGFRRRRPPEPRE